MQEPEFPSLLPPPHSAEKSELKSLSDVLIGCNSKSVWDWLFFSGSNKTKVRGCLRTAGET